MLLLYPGELYRLLGASSLLFLFIVKLTCKDHYHCFIHIFIMLNSIGGVMVGMLAVSVVDHGWLESDRDKPFRLNIWYYMLPSRHH